MGLESIIHHVFNNNMMCTCLSLGTPSIHFSSVLKGHKGIIAHEFVLSFIFLTFPYLVLLFFSLEKKAWRTLTSICTLFYSLGIFLPIPEEFGKISNITWILVFIIVLRATCLVDLPLSPNNPCNFKENIIDCDNRHVLLLQHII